MRITPALVVTLACSILGTLGGYPHLWLPYTGLVASLIDRGTRAWVTSDRLGESAGVSAVLKFAMALVGLYAIIAMPACVILAIYWLSR